MADELKRVFTVDIAKNGNVSVSLPTYLTPEEFRKLKQKAQKRNQGDFEPWTPEEPNDE